MCEEESEVCSLGNRIEGKPLKKEGGKCTPIFLYDESKCFKTEHRLRSPELGVSKAYVTEGSAREKTGERLSALEKRLRLCLLRISGI